LGAASKDGDPRGRKCDDEKKASDDNRLSVSGSAQWDADAAAQVNHKQLSYANQDGLVQITHLGPAGRARRPHRASDAAGGGDSDSDGRGGARWSSYTGSVHPGSPI